MIKEGDCLAEMQKFESDSIDLIVTDPPYALVSGTYKEGKTYKGGFMGKNWDAVLPSIEIWKECLRVLKPGAFAFVMCSPRQDVLARMIVRLGDAGFETNFTPLFHTFASGFPKSANVAKNIAKQVDSIISWNGYLDNATTVDKQLEKQLTEVGIPITKNDSVVIPARVKTEIKKSIQNVGIVESHSSEVQVTSTDNITIVVESVDTSQEHSIMNVSIVESSASKPYLNTRKVITVQENALISACEEMLNRIKGGEVQKTYSGNLRFLKELGINALYAELIESWKHIILNQLKNILSLDMISIMECVSVTTVITTKFIMEHLITNMVNTLRKSLRQEAQKFEGWFSGFQPKPAVEVILVVQKPNEEKTYVDQALSNGKGCVNFEDCRIPYQSSSDMSPPRTSRITNIKGGSYGKTENKQFIELDEPIEANQKGRFPANLLVSDDVLNDGKITKSPSSYVRKSEGRSSQPETLNPLHYGKRIGESTGKLSLNYGDSGSFSRYFSLDAWAEKTLPFLIVPKASKAEKNEGLEDMPAKSFSGIGALRDRPTETILVRAYEPPNQKEIAAYLRDKIYQKYEHHTELAKDLGVAESLIRHWIGKCGDQDLLPTPEYWTKLKKLLGFEDGKYDKIMMEVKEVKRENFKSLQPKQNHHPTVKPIKLMSYLITMGSRPNDTILDPFMGSGTTGIAALQLGRKFIGIEKEKEYVEIANKRLKPYMAQTKLMI